MVYVIHMTEWRIRLRAKILNGVRSSGHVSFNRLWVSQVEGVMHGWTLNACSVRSLIEPVRVLTQRSSRFTAAPAWIWLIVASVVIQTGRPLSLSSVFIWQRVTLSDSRDSPPRLSVNVPVQSASVTGWESCCMSSDACCACRCQGGYLCCRVGHRSPPLCLCLSSPLFSTFTSPGAFLSPSLLLSPSSTLPLLRPLPLPPSLPPLFHFSALTR